MMLPNTAVNLRESKRNQLKDFVSVAGPLGVSHFMILTGTDSSSYLRIAKTPRVRGCLAAGGMKGAARRF
jgi:ribosome biogenesis protein SSF1/2